MTICLVRVMRRRFLCGFCDSRCQLCENTPTVAHISVDLVNVEGEGQGLTITFAGRDSVSTGRVIYEAAIRSSFGRPQPHLAFPAG